MATATTTNLVETHYEGSTVVPMATAIALVTGVSAVFVGSTASGGAAWDHQTELLGRIVRVHL